MIGLCDARALVVSSVLLAGPTGAVADIVHADCDLHQVCVVQGNSCRLPKPYTNVKAVIDTDLSTWTQHWTYSDGSTEDSSGVMYKISGFSYDFVKKDWDGRHPDTIESILRGKSMYHNMSFPIKNGIEAAITTLGPCKLD